MAVMTQSSSAVAVPTCSVCPPQATLSQELSRIDNSNDGFLALVIHDNKLDPSRLQIKHGVGGIALGANMTPLGN
jgi:hypothetical protein